MRFLATFRSSKLLLNKQITSDCVLVPAPGKKEKLIAEEQKS
jgi:hypothetical protein